MRSQIAYALAHPGIRSRKADHDWPFLARGKLNLNDLLPPWESELPNVGDEPEFDRILRGDLNIAHPASGKDVVRQTRPLAQDVFRALVIRQRAIE